MYLDKPRRQHVAGSSAPTQLPDPNPETQNPAPEALRCGAQVTWGLLMADGRKPYILNPKLGPASGRRGDSTDSSALTAARKHEPRDED
jgi:hypothetical protein